MIITILGMHRSGTSCLAGSFQAAGLFSGDVIEFSADNLKGNRENQDIMDLNNAVLAYNHGSWDKPPQQQLSWTDGLASRRNDLITNRYQHSPVWMFKDPRTTLTLPFWQSAKTDLQVVGTFRHPLKVALSLYQRSQMPLRQGVDLWIHYNRILLEVWEKNCFPLLCFDLSQATYLDELERAITKLNLELPNTNQLSIEAAQAFYTTELIHQVGKTTLVQEQNGCLVDEDTQRLATAEKLYQNLLRAAGLDISIASHQFSEVLLPIDDSLFACRQALELQPATPHLYFMLGNAQLREGDREGAINSYRGAIQLAPAYSEAIQSLANLFIQQNQLDEAASLYRQAIVEQPNNPVFSFQLGSIQSQQGNTEAAIIAYRKAVELAPTYLQAHLELGNILSQNQRFEEAICIYENAIQLYPRNAHLHFLLGNTQQSRGNFEAAAFAYREALQCNPRNLVGLHIKLGHVLAQIGNPVEALQSYQQAIAIQPNNPRCYFALGNYYQKIRDWDAAIAAYHQVIRLDYEYRAVYKHLEVCLTQQEQLNKSPTRSTITHEDLGLELRAGDAHYRAYVGPPKDYDLIAAMGFNLLTTLGLRQHHTLLDIGCGSLSIGRLLIPYLNKGHYAGIEPNQWLVEEGVRQEIGTNLVQLKQPSFYYTDSTTSLSSELMFDFAIAQSIFSHCSRLLFQKWLLEISEHLQETGALVATFIQGDQDFEGDGWIYPGCVQYRTETILQLAANAELQVHFLDWIHPRQSWVLFYKREFDASWLTGQPLSWNLMMQYYRNKKQ